MAITNLEVGRPTMTAVSDEITGRVYVKYIRYIGTAGTAAGEVATLVDSNDKELFSTIADGAEFIDVMPVWGIINGVKVSAITTGKFVVYLG